jgi:hypothetical protein
VSQLLENRTGQDKSENMHLAEMRALKLVSMVDTSLWMVLVSRFGIMRAVMAEAERRILLLATILRAE